MIKKTCKQLIKIFYDNFTKGFSLMEVLIGVLIYSIIFTSVMWGFASIVRLEIKTKEKIYEGVEQTGKISEENYIFPEYE